MSCSRKGEDRLPVFLRDYVAGIGGARRETLLPKPGHILLGATTLSQARPRDSQKGDRRLRGVVKQFDSASPVKRKSTFRNCERVDSVQANRRSRGAHVTKVSEPSASRGAKLISG